MGPFPKSLTTTGWLRNRGGSVTTVFSFAAIAIFAASWLAINTSHFFAQKARMQAAADGAALGAAKQLSLASVSVTTVQQVARALVLTNLPPDPESPSPDQIVVNVDTSANKINVAITREATSLISDLFTSFATISVNATAQFNSSPICVLTLATSGVAYDSRGISKLSANGCAIVSNSKDANGLTAITTGGVTSIKNCSAGGYFGGGFTPTPITDCPPTPDPLASRPPPPSATNNCDYTNFQVNNSGFALKPGVYCGGIYIMQGVAQFLPGDYIIRGGSLTVNAGGSMTGSDVGFYLTGGAVLNAKPNSALSLSAPSSASDPMAGLLFWEDPKNSGGGAPLTHTIYSNNGQNLHGTVYFPHGNLMIGGSANIGGASAYTIIVAYNLLTDQLANVVLNSNYSVSNIPVPQGVGNTTSSAELTQ